MIFDWLHTLDETATAVVEVEKDKTSKEEKEEKWKALVDMPHSTLDKEKKKALVSKKEAEMSPFIVWEITSLYLVKTGMTRIVWWNLYIQMKVTFQDKFQFRAFSKEKWKIVILWD